MVISEQNVQKGIFALPSLLSLIILPPYQRETHFCIWCDSILDLFNLLNHFDKYYVRQICELGCIISSFVEHFYVVHKSVQSF